MPRILNHLTVVRDGMHNMGPHLLHWRGEVWLGYRKAEWHFHSPGGTIHLLRSVDLRRWREAATFKAPGDNRDSELVVDPHDRLAVLWVTVNPDPDGGNQQTRQHIAFSANGHDWSPPQPLLRPGDHLFRVIRQGDHYLGLNCVRHGRARQLFLMSSTDLLQWEAVSQIGPDELLANEAAIWIDGNQQAHVVARTLREPDDLAVYATAPPPYRDWRIADLPGQFHCPRVLVRPEGVYLSARRFPRKWGESQWPFGATLGVWRVDPDRAAGQMMTLLLAIPAVGDCAYSSMIEGPAGRVLLAYYSQHAYYLGVLPPFAGKVTEESIHFGAGDYTPAANDIYLAELELP